MEGMVVRRVIPSDNGCLFNAVGYVMDHDQKKAPELRQVIAATVASDPTKYSEAFLGKSNEEYCAWILDSEKWGERVMLIYDGLHYDALALQRSLIRRYLQSRTVPLGQLRGSPLT
ncbi:ubiquitin thioesterase OTU1-like [Pyrus ussuriensis x Pyrus communis]|uniref:Ubiquitin thioesterase OTU n=1 Tax=Pyrus ussuriensis x Pyrus communis TaxID=2448454 RepID=A0A5N5GLH8_9ROSA|nr:ubiquitin thioesterase OTU1-like [Pyrus ussuriensis x Pyrus communis]